MTEDITSYLNSLESDVTDIDISYRRLTKLPDLSRFENLNKLNCSNNQLTSLAPLNVNLKELNCSYNKLTSLPPLNCNLLLLKCFHNQLTSLPPLNVNLEFLNCFNNQLTSLPPLNYSLKYLFCSNNQLTSLPPLNFNLVLLYCDSNQLTALPPLNDKLINLFCFDNQLTSLPALNDNLNVLCCYNNPPINKIIGFVTKSKITKWNHFREFYFLSKLREKFISWMWKSKEEQIRKQFHPSHLINFLKDNNVSEDDGESLNIFLNQWVSN